jgi:hypothetical protein
MCSYKSMRVVGSFFSHRLVAKVHVVRTNDRRDVTIECQRFEPPLRLDGAQAGLPKLYDSISGGRENIPLEFHRWSVRRLASLVAEVCATVSKYLGDVASRRAGDTNSSHARESWEEIVFSSSSIVSNRAGL